MTRRWPDIPFDSWKDTSETLHQWLQIVGKYRLAHTPWLNHSWHATFYVTARGLTTSVIHCGETSVQIDFDFVGHRLIAEVSDGRRSALALEPMSVAQFHERFLKLVEQLGVAIDFDGAPNEVPDPVPFARNTMAGSYDADAVHRFWLALLEVDRVFKYFRTGFLGKVSPVHLFWGSFDLAVTRFSGRKAPTHPGGVPALPDDVTREAYSHEVSSAGFWGGAGLGFPAFYSYAYPAPEGFAEQPVTPSEAYFDVNLGEFLLPYDAVRKANDPDRVLLDFLQSTYDAAALLASWDREELECPRGLRRVPRAV
ncbi:MAG TPA: DUF5996 family protein [Polyangiales bacterium]|nr:DUF5996 family protein [Polyangiales bacterium]